MNILKWLLNIKQDSEVEQLIREATNKPLTPKDIGEPVLSMVELIKKYPKRFKFHGCSWISGYNFTHSYFKMTDRTTGQQFNVGYEIGFNKPTKVLEGIFTADEADLLLKTLEEVRALRTKNVREYLQTRKARYRAKLTEYYQGELLK